MQVLREKPHMDREDLDSTKKPQALGTFLLWGNSANPWLSCLRFYLHLQRQQWNTVTEPNRRISSWLKSGCLSITLHHITHIQLSSKLEMNLIWILGCCLNMWLVLKDKQDKTHKCENTWNKSRPRCPKGVGRNINLVNPTLSPYLILKFIRFPVFLDLLLWRQTTLQSHLISSLCSLHFAVQITGNWYHSGLDNDLEQDLSGFLKSYLGAVWMPLHLSTLRSWKSPLKSKLPQGRRDYVLLSPLCPGTMSVGFKYRTCETHILLWWFFKGVLWVDYQLYFPQVLIRRKCVWSWLK